MCYAIAFFVSSRIIHIKIIRPVNDDHGPVDEATSHGSGHRRSVSAWKDLPHIDVDTGRLEVFAERLPPAVLLGRPAEVGWESLFEDSRHTVICPSAPRARHDNDVPRTQDDGQRFNIATGPTNKEDGGIP